MLPPETRDLRRARRAVYRAYHPDLGGDPEELIDRMRALEPGPVLARRSTENVVFVRRRRLDGLRARIARRHRPPRVV
jgi:hypothetical protein